ncbi:MAG: hypothetical protein AMXMBFR4_14070 [Candidatus Hydrogenedentota bacterium]
MVNTKVRGESQPGLQKGNRCLLHVVNQYFLVEITDIGIDAIHVTFPGRDYPVEGMSVILDFHDESGFNSYRATVLNGPAKTGGGLLLSKPVELRRTLHRSSCRVPTDLTVQVKSRFQARRYDAALIDLSGGGALIETEAPFDFSTPVEIILSLPGEPQHVLNGQVVHIGSVNRNSLHGKRIIGVRFLGTTPEATHSLGRYVWRRLREIYPAQ